MPTLSQVSRLCLKNILVPTDFSPASRTALPFAQSLAQTYGSTILLAHAIAPEPHRQIPTDHIPEEDSMVWDHARAKMAEFARDGSLTGLCCQMLVERGDVGDVIPNMIGEHAVDMVVVGTHGRRGVSKLVLGSEAEKIYRSATCPVLIVGPRAGRPDRWTLRQILCPIEPSESPAPVLQYALSLAEEHQSRLILLEAMPLVPWQHRSEMEEKSCAALEALIPEEARNWCNLEYMVRWGHPAESIVNQAETRGVDLIVMSVHKSRVISSHLPWPVASEVISQAGCPVLTIRV
ncbi:MAG TPA: universal stress protein [Dongiaceae bacterium]|nr:universal stress protein [Dongiaceae bacterium]